MANGALTPIIGLRLLALAAGLRHNAEIGQPGLCFSAYGHKFGINHLVVEMNAGDDLDGDDRRDRPIDHKTERRPPACVGNKLTAVLPEVFEAVASETGAE